MSRQIGQNGRPIKKAQQKTTPAGIARDARKTAFLRDLEANGGNVSAALRTSRLNRDTAYEHFKTDKVFASAWLDALEAGNEALFTEARRRAVIGTLKPVYQGGKKVGAVRQQSDTMLIFLLKQGEAQKKWRNRIIQTGQMAVDAVQEAGTKMGCTEEQIRAVQNAMLERFEKISLL